MENNETFTYTYSAKQQEEIEAIRKKYLPKPAPSDYEAKLAQLRKLDASADRAGKITSLAAGLIGVTLFAYGMVCVTSWSDKYFSLGVVIGLLGLVLMAAAFPLNHIAAARKREKIAPEVLRLTEELEKES